METKKLDYRWLMENKPDFAKFICIYKNVPCLMNFCPAWYSSGDGYGRCLMVPGYHEEE